MCFVTKETFYVDAIRMKLKCWCCGKEAIHRIGWVAMECSNCKMEYSLDDYAGDLVKRMRNELGLTRPQMAGLTGYSKHTIKKYEFGYCTMAYYKKMQKIFIQNIPKDKGE